MQLAIAQAIETDFLSDACITDECNGENDNCIADITNCKYETNSCDTDGVAVSICRQLTISPADGGLTYCMCQFLPAFVPSSVLFWPERPAPPHRRWAECLES